MFCFMLLLLLLFTVYVFVYVKVSKQTGSGWWFGEVSSRGKARQTGWFPGDHVDLLQKKANVVANTTPPPQQPPSSSSGQPSSGQQAAGGGISGASVLGAQRARSVSEHCS